MVFKENIVRERVKYLQEALEKLESLRKTPKSAFLNNHEKYWAAEHGLHLCAETIFDIGNHVLVGRFSENPRGYNEIIPALVAKGVLSRSLGTRFEKVGGFRNILIHEYMRVDRQLVYEHLQKGLSDFYQFVKEIVQWLESQS